MIADLVVGGPYDLVVSNPPYVRDADWPGLAPEITLYEPEEALLGGPDGLDVIRRLVPAAAEVLRPGGLLGDGGRPGPVARRRGALRALRAEAARDAARPRGDSARGQRPALISPADVAAFERCIEGGGVAVFPTDTLYGIGCAPGDDAARERVYELKGRPRDRPSAVMYFSLEAAAEVLAPLGPRTRAAAERLLPGPGAGGAPGWRGPAGAEGRWSRSPACALPVLQTSANLTRRPRAAAARGRAGGAAGRAPTSCSTAASFPGVASTVVDLTRYEDEGDVGGC